MDAFFGTGPESIRLVLQDGRVKLFDEDLLAALATLPLTGFSRIKIGAALSMFRGSACPDRRIRTYRPETPFPFTLDNAMRTLEKLWN